jgi:hypothetical protein
VKPCLKKEKYLGSRDQEDQGSRPTQTKSYQDSISKNKLGVVVYAI